MEQEFIGKSTIRFSISITMFFLLLHSSPCFSQERNLYKIDPRTFVENKITLEEIADKVDYIPLDNYYPMGDIVLIRIINSSIYINIRDVGLVDYNRDGKIVKKIGSIGRGPGEYLSCTSFDVDEMQNTIYIKDMDEKIQVYSKNGKFLRSIDLKLFGAFHFTDIELFNSKLFVFEYITMGNGKYNWIVLDTLGNLITHKENSIPKFRSGMGADGGTYKFGNKLYYWNMYNDTIFSIMPDLSYKASYVFAPGEHRMPTSYIRDRSPYMVPKLISETQRYFMIEYNVGRLWADAVIDKKSRRTYINYLDPDHYGGIVNYLDGGTKFRPISYFVENAQEYLIGFVSAYKLKIHVVSSEFKNSTPKYPEKKKDLEKLANRLNETDNPVLMLVRLKK